MEALLSQPKPMIMVGDLSLNWKKFKKQFKLYLTAISSAEMAAERKAALLLHIIGEEALEVFETFELSEVDSKNPKIIINKFDDYFIPKTNVSVERHKFHTRVQKDGESFETFH